MDSLEFELTRQDCRHAVEAHFRSRAGSWPVRVISLVLMILGSLRIVDGDYIWGTVFFAAGLTYPGFSARVASYAVVRRKPIELGTVRLTLRDGAIHVDREGETAILTHLQRVAVAPRTLLLYLDHSRYVIIPRRVFKDASQYERVVDRARELLDAPMPSDDSDSD